MRRQTWLQRNQAVQVINTYGEAMGGGKQANRAAPQEQSRTYAGNPQGAQGNKVSGGDLLRMMGQRTVKDI